MGTNTSNDRSGSGLVLGLDLGISTAKAVLFNCLGQLIAVESKEYFTLPKGTDAEVDAEIFWQAIATVIRGLLKRWGGDSAEILAVSVSSHTETVIPMSFSGTPAGPAILWMDERSRPEADELRRLVGSDRVMEISGQAVICPIWPLVKFRWLRKTRPDQCQRTDKYLLPSDYLIFRLCGQMVAEQTVWSSSLALDIRRKLWSEEMLEFGMLSQEQLPRICAPGTLVGTVSPLCSSETGLHQSTKVVAGALDQVCAALAVNNMAPGIVSASIGSVLALLATVSEPMLDAGFGIPCHIHALPDTYCLLPWNPTGGLVLKWFKDSFVPSSDANLELNIYEMLSREAQQVPPGSDGLLMLPHLSGALFPENDPSARAAFFGITLHHGRPHFVRAIMEAVAFMIRRNLEGLESLGVATRELRIMGGGARSKLWTQIMADVCGVSLAAPAQEEAAALGAAILAAVGAGLYPDIPTAAQSMTKMCDAIEPAKANRDVYDKAYDLYKRLYAQVNKLYVECDRIKQYTQNAGVIF